MKINKIKISWEHKPFKKVKTLILLRAVCNDLTQ